MNVHSDVSYLWEYQTKRSAGGNVFLSDNSKDPSHNVIVLNIAKLMKNVMSSAAEAETGALFLNSRPVILAITTLIKMGHPQPPSPIETDNTTAIEFVGKNLTPKATQSTDIQHWWMRD